MQNIPIIGQGKHGPEIQTIRTSDILHIERISHHAYKLHTTDNAVILNITLETLQEWLFEDGFRLIDRNHLVNIHHIQDFDTQKGKVFFGDPQLPATKSAPLARSQYKHLEALLQLMGTHTELTIEEAASAIQASLDPNSAPEFERSYRTFLEVAERQRAENQIRYMAYHDALTGLPNRLKLRESMLEAFEQAQRSGNRVAVFFLDLDRLKVINDTLGHHVGDLLLKYWAASFESLIAKHGVVARFSGDEFIMLLPNVKELEFVQMMADDVIRLFRTPFLYMKQELYSTASIGIAMYPKDGEDPDTLLKYADSAMYVAKSKGGNAYAFYNPEQNERSMQRLQLEMDLRRAIDRQEFSIHYQPIVDLSTGRMNGMESLIRWYHPQRGYVPPMEFIPLAEETGLILTLGAWVLEEACRQNKEWQLQGLPPVRVSVNISVKQFQQPQFVKLVKLILELTGLDAQYLCLEITENVAMTNVGHVIETFHELRELGVCISMDDFGTGYSSLSYFKRFPVQTLKIDKSFIQGVHSDEESAAIVTALIAMASRLNIRTLAEGVETADQLEFLRELGCDEIQGYYFSKPLTVGAFRELLLEERHFMQMPL